MLLPSQGRDKANISTVLRTVVGGRVLAQASGQTTDRRLEVVMYGIYSIVGHSKLNVERMLSSDAKQKKLFHAETVLYSAT